MALPLLLTTSFFPYLWVSKNSWNDLHISQEPLWGGRFQIHSGKRFSLPAACWRDMRFAEFLRLKNSLLSILRSP